MTDDVSSLPTVRRSLLYAVSALIIIVLAMFHQAPTLQSQAPDVTAVLQIQSDVPVDELNHAMAPILFTSNGLPVSRMDFSIDYDHLCLLFDPMDVDGDGIPDNLFFDVPDQFEVSASFASNDIDGEIDVTIAAVSPPTALLPDAAVLTIRLNVLCIPGIGFTIRSPVRFSQSPSPSLRTASGSLVPGTFVNGSVLIVGESPVETPMPSVTPTPTRTAQPTGTAQPPATSEPPLTPLPTATDAGTIPGTIPETIPPSTPTRTSSRVFMPVVLVDTTDMADRSVRVFMPMIAAECAALDPPASCPEAPAPDPETAVPTVGYADVPRKRYRLPPRSTAPQ